MLLIYSNFPLHIYNTVDIIKNAIGAASPGGRYVNCKNYPSFLKDNSLSRDYIPAENPLKAVAVYEQVAKRIANFPIQRKRRKFISTAASETERKRPDDVFFNDETDKERHVGSFSYLSLHFYTPH